MSIKSRVHNKELKTSLKRPYVRSMKLLHSIFFYDIIILTKR